ncbi:putative immunity protein [Acetobacterium bakii]|uniref:putative immunity protein n=1 Tax=Acetobacterium bakii TaxID=52689 RepID=UPI003119E577
MARMHDVRQAGFKVHQLAKESKDAIFQAALRVAGQAIRTGRMREHAMVASDYAIKVINLKFPDNMAAVKNEQEWQIRTLN